MRHYLIVIFQWRKEFQANQKAEAQEAGNFNFKFTDEEEEDSFEEKEEELY